MPRVVKVEYELNNVQRYPCSKRSIKKLFKEFDTLDVLFERGSIFNFERPNAPSKNDLLGELYVMSAQNELASQQEFGEDAGGPTLWIYAIDKTRYDEKAAADFRETIGPALCDWLKKEFSKPDAARSRDTKISIEWDGARHQLDESHP